MKKAVITALVALSLLVPFPAVLKAAATVVQIKIDEATTCLSTDTCNVSFSSNVTSGNAVICGANTVNGSSTTFTCSDATNGTYTNTVHKISSGTGRTSDINDKRSVTGGFTQVTVTASASITGYSVYLYEVSGLSASAAQTGTNEDGSSVTTHNTSSAGLSATGFALALGASSTQAGGITAGSGWTLDSDSATFPSTIAQHKVATFSSDQCAYTGNAEDNIGACAIFPEATTACKTLATLGVGC